MAIFSKRRHLMQARRAWIPSWVYRKLITRICPNVEMLHFIHKNVSRVVFRKVWFSDLPITWLLIEWLAYHMASRSQWRMAAIMTSLSWHHHHHDVTYFAFTKMADSHNYWQKYTWLLPSIYTFFGLIFQKPLTCIRNDIVLHVYFNPKCYENWRKAVYHASSDSVQRVVSYRAENN